MLKLPEHVLAATEFDVIVSFANNDDRAYIKIPLEPAVNKLGMGYSDKVGRAIEQVQSIASKGIWHNDVWYCPADIVKVQLLARDSEESEESE